MNESFTYKFAVLSVFLLIAIWAVRRDRTAIIVVLTLTFSNINGLLGWEDFALKGLVKFQDYGLVTALLIIAHRMFRRRNPEPPARKYARGMALYNLINMYWVYLICLLLFSFVLQGPVWPIKMGRVFFYGISIYVLYAVTEDDPQLKFSRLLNWLFYTTLFFGILYCAYNMLGWKIYAVEEYESFNVSFFEKQVNRNFSGFPTFAPFFIFFAIERLIRDVGKFWLNSLAVAVLLACVAFMLSRFTLVLIVTLASLQVVVRRHNGRTVINTAVLIAGALTVVALFTVFASTHVEVLLRRFSEFGQASAIEAANSRVRIAEFFRVVKNVVDFNPLFGFGFTVPAGFGYQTNVMHGGSADNGYTNVFGISGITGSLLFVALIATWFSTNWRLRRLRAEYVSNINLIYLLFVLGAMMNNGHAAELSYFYIFMTYDLLVYSQLAQKTSGPQTNVSADMGQPAR